MIDDTFSDLVLYCEEICCAPRSQSQVCDHPCWSVLASINCAVIARSLRHVVWPMGRGVGQAPREENTASATDGFVWAKLYATAARGDFTRARQLAHSV